MKNDTLYGSIISYIKEGIENGMFLPEQQIPTEMSLVKQFGVSRPTVNKALSELSLEGTIYRVPGRGSFVSNKKDVQLKRGGPIIISLITPFEEGFPYRNDEIEIIRGVESYLKQKGCFLTLQFTHQDSELEKLLIKKSWQEGIDGIILYPSVNFSDFVLIHELVMEDYPLLMLDVNVTGLPVLTVQSDNRNGGFLATNHLIDMGYEDIYFISDLKINNHLSVRERYLGYREALSHHGMKFMEQYCIEGYALSVEGKTVSFVYGDNPGFYRELVEKILRQSEGKRIGVFVINDPIAYSIVSALMDLNIKVPEAFGIVGFDDTGSHNGLFTSVKQNFYDIGRKSAEVMYRKITGEANQNDTYVAIEFIAGKTTGCMNQACQK